MALSEEKTVESLTTLLRQYDIDAYMLTETEKQILTTINQLAARNDIALSSQNRDLLDTLIRTIKQSSSIKDISSEDAPQLIYGFLLQALEEQSEANRSRHRIQGQFDKEHLYLRAARDQMQDHDITFMMPKSKGNIRVMAVLNNHDNSALAIQDVLANEIYDEEIEHIIIPIGPGHWRGLYLTKPSDDELYDLELFDPYGGTGAKAIEKFALHLLESCGLPRELIKIRYTGPLHPQGDAYSCGDFTCAYSHKKMKEFGAPAESYNEILITTLDNLGNVDNALRLATREEIQKLVAPRVSISEPSTPSIAPVTPDPLKTNGPTINPITADKPKSMPSEPVISAPAVENKSSNERTSLATTVVIALSTAIGALIGGIIGFSLLPALAMICIGIVAGAAIGTLLGFAAVGLTRLFENEGKTASSLNNESTVSPNPESSALDTSLDHTKNQDKEPIISPPLFATAPTTPITPPLKTEAEHISSASPN